MSCCKVFKPCTGTIYKNFEYCVECGNRRLKGDDEEPQAGCEAVSAELALLYTEDQIIKWCKRWWQDDAWREEQKKTYGCDTAHLLRGVADMIEGV